MKYAIPALTLLLCACTPAGDGGNAAIEANGAVPDVPIQGTEPAPGAAPQQPGGNQDAPEPSGEIGFTASPNRVAPGGTLALTLANRSSAQIGYNLCTSGIQTAAGAAVQTDRICTMELRTLEPGDSATYAYELPDDLEPGRYRLTTGATRMDSDSQTTVQTGLFEVTG